MHALIESFKPLYEQHIKKYVFEIILLSVAAIIALISLIVILTANKTESSADGEEMGYEESVSPRSSRIPYSVDLSGAVLHPGVYEATPGSRIRDVIQMAGGLSPDADVMYFQRNANLARYVADQDKIYVPSLSETGSGIILENQRVLDYTNPREVSEMQPFDQSLSEKVSINTGTLDELDTLPGVGKATAGVIIQGRPYTSIQDLLTKKVVKSNVFEQIENLVSL